MQFFELMNLPVVRVGQALHEKIPIVLKGENVMAEAFFYRLTTSFHLSVNLWLVCNCCQIICI